MQREFDNSSEKESRENRPSSKQLGKIEPEKVEKRVTSRQEQPKDERQKPRNMSPKDMEEMKKLNHSLNQELHSYRSDIDREKEKQLLIIERRAQKL